MIRLCVRRVQHSGADTQANQLRCVLNLTVLYLFLKIDKAHFPAPLRVSCWICRVWPNSQYSCFLPGLSRVSIPGSKPRLSSLTDFLIVNIPVDFCANTEAVTVPSMSSPVPYAPTRHCPAESAVTWDAPATHYLRAVIQTLPETASRSTLQHSCFVFGRSRV